MPYVTRNKQGLITSVSQAPTDGSTEVLASSPELIEFMDMMGMEQGTLLQSDLRLVRVLEDLVNLLIDREVLLKI